MWKEPLDGKPSRSGCPVRKPVVNCQRAQSTVSSTIPYLGLFKSSKATCEQMSKAHAIIPLFLISTMLPVPALTSLQQQMKPGTVRTTSTFHSLNCFLSGCLSQKQKNLRKDTKSIALPPQDKTHVVLTETPQSQTKKVRQFYPCGPSSIQGP